MLFFIIYVFSVYINSFSLLFKTAYVESPETFRMSVNFENFKEKASIWGLQPGDTAIDENPLKIDKLDRWTGMTMVERNTLTGGYNVELTKENMGNML